MQDPLGFILCVLLCSLQGTTSLTYPFTASDFEKECIDMFPEVLQTDAQTSKPPYEVSVSDSIYEGVPYEEVKIKATGAYKINAFFIQARVADCSSKDVDKPIGYFREEPLHEGYVEFVNCNGEDSSAVMNRIWAINRDEVKVRWHKPKNERRELYFRATIVANKNTFWMENFSSSIRALAKSSTLQFCPVKKKYTRNSSARHHSLLILIFWTVCIAMFA